MNAQAQLDVFVCIGCGAEGDARATDGRRDVREGDPVLCMQCGFLATMDGIGYQHHKMTDDEWESLPSWQQREIEHHREQVIERALERRQEYQAIMDCLAVVNGNLITLYALMIKYL